MPGHSVQTRDVNSREIDFARVRTFYRRDWSVIAGGGANGGRRLPAGPRHHCRPMPGPHCRLWTIDIAGGGVHETSQNGRGRVRGSATGEGQWPSAPGRIKGRVITARPRRTPQDNRSTSRADGRVKRHAAARSPAPWCTCQNVGQEHDVGTRLPTGPLDTGYGKSTGPPSDAANIAGGRHI